MLTTLEKIAFVALAIVSFYFSGCGFYRLYKVIFRGKTAPAVEHWPRRILRAAWVVLTQQTVIKKRPLISLLHALVFYGFVYYVAVNLIDLLEGFFSLHPRGRLWNPFNLLADLLTAGVLIGIIGLSIRRFITRPRDFAFTSKVLLHEGVKSGISRDSIVVAGFILFHVGCRLLYRTIQLAQDGPDPYQPVSSALTAMFLGMHPGTVELLSHVFWWGALGSILLFFPYFPRSKHIHLFLAPINLVLKKEKPGALEPMDFEKEEPFGAARLEDFTWPRLLDAYSCIMCNRCQEVCPAYVTGKALSPAAILINERFELNKIYRDFSEGAQSPRPLLDFALSEEAAWACTTCNACIEVCPVGNEQMLHILDVRRERVLTQAKFPDELKTTFNSMEQVGNPWGMSAQNRLDWTQKLTVEVPTTEQNPNPDVLFWVGCAAAYDPRAQKIARSMAEIFNAAGVNWAVLGTRERCTADAARRAGNEYLFTQLAAENIDTLNALDPKMIVTTCPHCFHTLANEYPQFGGRYLVKHHTDFIHDLIQTGKLAVSKNSDSSVTYHDPCYLGRHNGIFDQPRQLIRARGGQLAEPSRNRSNSFCCGAGGAQFWKQEESGAERVSTHRYRELKQTGAKTIATACPYCMRILADEAAKEEPEGAPEVLDLAEIVAKGLERQGD